MKKKRMAIILVSFLILFSLFNPVFSQKVNAEDTEEPEKPKGLMQLFGKFLAEYVFFIFRLSLVAARTTSPVIEIGYNETVSVDIGLWDFNTSDFEKWHREDVIFDTRFMNFEVLEYPSGNQDGTWFVNFEPNIVPVEVGSTLKTTATIKLRSPPSADNAIQSGILKIRIWDTWVLGDLWRPPEGHPSDYFIGRIMWFISAAFTMKFGSLTGTISEEYADVEILVKVKPHHYVEIDTISLLRFNPDEITSIPITLQNLGNYNDTFNFKIVSKHNDIKLSDPGSITLAPGERKDTFLGVIVPMSAFDYGTIHKIKIEAYSIDQPNITIGERTVILESRGVYISEANSSGLVIVLILIFLFVGYLMHRKKRKLEKILVKPDKPWEIPEEKEHLEQIKEKNQDEYKETLKMMKDEYYSSLLWYEDFINSKLRKRPVAKEKPIKKEKKKLKEKELKVKDKAKTMETKAEESVKEEKEAEVRKEIVDEPTIDKKTLIENRRKEKILLKIQREQVKQKKKMKK